ncbi:MAG: 3-phosphoshikimate 1-carboxyvinyltransferase [Bacteroidetes bacterium]|nr:3-phosphoshikimate 1-carboxyvinyltransferase [Bacteroidota bacterium]
MKAVKVISPKKPIQCSIDLPASKSIANRALILQAILPNITLNNLSQADDTILMQQALKSHTEDIHLKNAGTCMRFLTAYFASKEGKKVNLMCSDRMKERPIKTLVDALRELGADITYLEKEGYPPLAIQGKKLIGKSIIMNASESSQFISSLMLIAPSIENGLEIILEGEISSIDYIEMTAKLMQEFGFRVQYKNNKINIDKSERSNQKDFEYTIEADWSSAAFWYQIAAMSHDSQITLNSLSLESFQGDKIIAELLSNQVETRTISDNIVIHSNQSKINNQNYPINLKHQPDLSPALVVSLASLGIEAKIEGLQNLKIKESNRLQALHDELTKLGYAIKIDGNSLEIKHSGDVNPSTPLRMTSSSIQELNNQAIQQSVNLKIKNNQIKTYMDHRMAMAFAPLALVFGEVIIENPDVVEKSYPYYWDDLKKAGFGLEFFEV